MDLHPHSNDVILGRGKGSYLHIGNYEFHKLVDIHKKKYLNSQKTEKTKISRWIVKIIQSQNPPGRFIEYDAMSGTWMEVNEKRAWEKTCQALRERKSSKHKNALDGNFKRISNFRNVSSADTAESDISEITTTKISSLFPPLNQKPFTLKRVDKYESAAYLSQSRPNRMTSKILKPETTLEVQEVIDDIEPNLCISNFIAPPQSQDNGSAKPHPQLLSQVQLSRFMHVRELKPGHNEDLKFCNALRKLRRKQYLKFPGTTISSDSVPDLMPSEILQASRHVMSLSQNKQQLSTKPFQINWNLHPNSNLSLASNENHMLQVTGTTETEACHKITLPIIPKMKFAVSFE